MGAIMSSLS